MKTTHLVQHYHFERRGGLALIHEAAHMEVVFIGARVNHRVNERAIVVADFAQTKMGSPGTVEGWRWAQ